MNTDREDAPQRDAGTIKKKNFSEMLNSPTTRRNTKSHQGTAKKGATKALRGKKPNRVKPHRSL